MQPARRLTRGGNFRERKSGRKLSRLQSAASAATLVSLYVFLLRHPGYNNSSLLLSILVRRFLSPLAAFYDCLHPHPLPDDHRAWDGWREGGRGPDCTVISWRAWRRD